MRSTRHPIASAARWSPRRQGIFFGITMPSWKAQLSPEDASLMVREILLKAQAGKIIQPDPDPWNGAPPVPPRTE